MGRTVSTAHRRGRCCSRCPCRRRHKDRRWRCRSRGPRFECGGGRERGGLFGVAREVDPGAFVDAHLPIPAAVRDGELHLDIVPGQDRQRIGGCRQQRAACHGVAVNTDRAVVADGKRTLDRARLIREAQQFRRFGGEHVKRKPTIHVDCGSKVMPMKSLEVRNKSAVIPERRPVMVVMPLDPPLSL
jgi:hypothetical protein